MRSKTPKHYLPRGYISDDTSITVDELSRDNNLYISETIEKLLLESPTFNKELDELRRMTPWMDDPDNMKK